MFGWLENQLSNVKEKMLRIIFPNEHGGTNYYAYKHHLLTFYYDPFICWWPAAKVFLKFWKIPFAIQDLQKAVDYGDRGLKDAAETAEMVKHEIECLINALADQKFHSGKIPEGMSEDDFYKKCYREVFFFFLDYDSDSEGGLAVASICGVRLPSKYLTKDEDSYRFDMDYEYGREVMCGCHETWHDELLFLANDLKERGFYDNES